MQKSNKPHLKALSTLGKKLRKRESRQPISFDKFLEIAARKPSLAFRDIFQLFHDMVHHYVRVEESDAYWSTGFQNYNCTRLFEQDCDSPFFADRLFANRFIKLTDGFKKGIQNNNIFLFEGPPGSGKSTFLNNVLQKLEAYSKTHAGSAYQTHWKLDVKKLGGFQQFGRQVRKASDETGNADIAEHLSALPVPADSRPKDFLEFDCPNHDHPILHIPKQFRMEFLDELITDEDFKKKLFHDKEYEWVLKEIPCSVCSSLYATLLDMLDDPLDILEMLHVRRAEFNRQYSDGISIFNPGDPEFKKPLTNPTTQQMINDLLKSDTVTLVFSNLAKTNNGVLALMDIKDQNIKRLMNLHGIISDGIHKVELVEERVKSLFVGLVNPADKSHYEHVPSFQDRIITVNVPYILDYNTEVQIFKNKFGQNIEKRFLPGVLKNVARIIVSSRLDRGSHVLTRWLGDFEKYEMYMDDYALLLKMELYAGQMPAWLSDEDLKRFDKNIQKDIIAASELEGNKGFSGRQSLNIFNALLGKYNKNEELITMEMVSHFFNESEQLIDEIPEDFIDALQDMYDYNILQEVKEAIYSYNEAQISTDIQNYLYCLNYEIGEEVTCSYTGEYILITDDYLSNFEGIILGSDSSYEWRISFRKDTHARYVSQTLAQEIQLKNKSITATKQHQNLFEKYTQNLKQNALAPYIDNDNFRRAVLDFGSSSFKSYDKRLKRDIDLLVKNLQSKFGYTETGAKQICTYVIDNNLVRKY